MVATPATVFNSKQVQRRHHHKHLFRHQIPTTNDSHFIQLDDKKTISSTGQLPDTLSLLPDQNHPRAITNAMTVSHIPTHAFPRHYTSSFFNHVTFLNIRHRYPTATTKTRSTPSSVPCDPPITQVLGQLFDSLSDLYSAILPFKNNRYKAA